VVEALLMIAPEDGAQGGVPPSRSLARFTERELQLLPLHSPAQLVAADLDLRMAARAEAAPP
jgi:hypothetical protein